MNNIFFSYLSPLEIFNTRVRATNDSQLFGVLIIGCLFTLIGQFPLLYNEQISSSDPLIGVFSARLVATFLFIPLFFYIFSGLLFVCLRLFKSQTTNFDTRVSLFWAFTLVSPWGLVNALIKLLNCPVWFELSFAIIIFVLFFFFLYLFLKACSEKKL